MPIVICQDGVVRTLAGVDAGRSAKVYHAAENYACMDGVVRQVADVLDEIDHIEISLEGVSVCSLEPDGDGDYNFTVIGRDLATANTVGSIEVTATSIQANCTTSMRSIELYGAVYVVFRDGHRTYLQTAAKLDTFEFKVSYYLYFSGNGGYWSTFLDSEVKEGHVSGSTSGTTTISTANASGAGFTLSAQRRASGTTRNRQTFTSCTAGGRSIPITVVNRLT